MVTDEERDYMWRVYAVDPAARINLGIRRRLAPLLNNDRRKIELLNAILFSMHGTPVIYYGDEIGMGDNIFLGDRNGVRTPMQWSADRNAGFSRANPQRIFLPVIIDPEYHYETINVEAQSANPSSLLWWMKRLIALRKNHPVFGNGDIHLMNPGNNKILAFIRRNKQEQILIVANLSRFAQPVELDLSDYAGAAPVELFGNVRFPAVTEDGRYSLSVGPHGFYWFSLGRIDDAAKNAPIIDTQIDVAGETALDSGALDRSIETRLPAFLPQRRWFGSKAKHIRTTRIMGRLTVSPRQALFLIHVELDDGEPEIYALPLSMRLEAPSDTDQGIFLRVIDAAEKRWVITDGLADEAFAKLFLQIAMEGREIAGSGLRLKGRLIGGASTPLPDLATLSGKLPEAEQSNSNVVFGNQFILKIYRRLGEGVNPELEMGEHLTAKAHFPNTAPLVAAIEVQGVQGSSAPRTLAVVLTFVPNQGDAWHTFLDHAHRYFEALGALPEGQVASLCMPDDEGCAGGELNPPAAIASLIGPPLEMARLLGQRTAEMHAALADDRLDPAFAPESFNATYQRSLFQSMRNTLRAATNLLSQKKSTLTGDAAEMAQWLLANQALAIDVFRQLSNLPVHLPRIRIHGDYHLGQVLWTGKDFIIIDFEGEPARSVGERRLKRSPMRDIAGMVRSFDYAAWTTLHKNWALLAPDSNRLARGHLGVRLWTGWLSREFVGAYITRLSALRSDLVWPNKDETELVLRCWVLEKALYEIAYELNSRPDWVQIPLQAVVAILKDPKP
jgi:maltose alpha-D-glucosyltransferase/alpha-amylase